MKVDVEKKSEILKVIHVEIPSEVVSKEIDGAFANLQKRARIPGFRPGRIPRPILEQKFGKEIETDVVQKLVPDYCFKAIQQSGLTPVEMPQIEKMDFKRGSPILFTAVVEVKPELGEIHSDGLELSREKIEVSDEDVGKTLEHLQDTHSQLEVYPDEHGVERGDFVLLDYEGFESGQSFPGTKREGVLIEVGSGKLVPGFEEGLIGAQKGESRELNVPFPEDYHAKDIAGNTILFKIRVGEVKHKVIPSLDDEFAREVGEYDSLEDLKAKVRDEIMRHKEEDRRSQEREAAITFLVEKNSVECPPSMVERELRSLMMRALSVYGKDVDISEKIKAELEAEYAPIAERHVKAALILDALGKKEGLDASEPDVEAEIEKLAQRTDQAPEKVRQYLLSNEGSLSGLKTQIRERKTIEWLLSKAAVKNPA